MRSAGYTLIELLVVISIIGLLGVFTLSSLKGFSKDLPVNKALGEVQTLLRLAQSNATSSTLCNNQGAVSWSLKYLNATTIELRCNPADFLYRTYNLENAQVAITGDLGCPVLFPAILSYSSGMGTRTIFSSGVSTACLQSSTISITISNTKNTSATGKVLKMSKGGAIDVQ